MNILFSQNNSDLSREEWEECYRDYAKLYMDPDKITEEHVSRCWINLAHSNVRTLQARHSDDSGQLLGLAHFFPIYNVKRGMDLLFLDVLVVRPGARRRGVARALMKEWIVDIGSLPLSSQYYICRIAIVYSIPLSPSSCFSVSQGSCV